MTTKDLRNNIEKVLGNSIRCLMPSYWWKRLFGMVVDEVEKAENSITSLTRKIKETNNRIDDVESAKQESSVAVVEWNNMESTTTANNKEAYTLIRHCLENNKPIAVVVWNTIQGLANPHYVAKSFNIRNELNGTVAVWIRFISESTENHSQFLMFKLTEDGTLKLNKSENIYDDSMSDTSTNAVQNKVIKEYIDNAVQNVEIDVDDSLSETSTNPVQNKVIKAYVDESIATSITNALNTEV